MPGVDYSRFDRLVAEDAREEEQLEARRQEENEERAKQDLERRHRQELEAFRLAEEAECRKQGRDHPTEATVGSRTVDLRKKPNLQEEERAKQDLERRHQQELEALRLAEAEESGNQGREDPTEAAGRLTEAKAAGCAAGVDSNMELDEQEEIQCVDVDDFFRPATDEEKAERARLKKEKEDRRRQREEAAGKRPLRNEGMTPEQLQERIEKIKADRVEMAALVNRCDRPAVKARLCDFLVEMDNDLARLQEDPLELDDEDRRELRLFHLRKMQLPGAARTRREFASDTLYLPKALGPADAGSAPLVVNDEPWCEVSSFALDLGMAETPTVTIDVRIEAVERLPADAVSCHFQRDAFDLRILHSLEGRRYRLLKTGLQRDIVPEQSSFHTKRNHVIVRLAKRELVPWTDLCAADKHSRNPVLGWTQPS